MELFTLEKILMKVSNLMLIAFLSSIAAIIMGQSVFAADRYPVINPQSNEFYFASMGGDIIKAKITLAPEFCEDISSDKSKQPEFPIRYIMFNFDNLKIGKEYSTVESTHHLMSNRSERLQILIGKERAIYDIDYNNHHYTFSCSLTTNAPPYKGVTLYNTSAPRQP